MSPSAADSPTRLPSPTDAAGPPAAGPGRPIRFWHQGRVAEVPLGDATRSVLAWLREDARCTGTKEGCAEGDCGACTVVVGEADGAGGLRLKTVNACLQFLPTLDGKALFTVEDLAAQAAPAPLHPVQQAMVACHGSQCGFCTPGFVMSLWSCWEQHQAQGTRPSRQQLADELAGNLCRCTGYRPILDAGERMFDAAPCRLDRAPVAAALQALQGEAPLSAEGRFHAPRTLADFADLRLAKPQARILAGSTDIGLWVNKQFRDLGEILYIGDVAELRAVASTDGVLTIGAAASLEDAWGALATEWPALAELGLRFASPPVRHAGTMGGNVANGSPIGDSAPALIALGAQVRLRRGGAVRSLPLEDFYRGYMVNALVPGEFVEALVVPRRAVAEAGGGRQLVRGYKISKRFDSDISAVCLGLQLVLQDDRITEARIACGGMAATVARARGAEAALRGQAWTEATLQAAQAALASDFAPMTDLRASAAYRTRVLQNLLRRAWLETRPEDPLPPGATTVWARTVSTQVEGAA